MKIVVQVKLMPDAVQASALERTLRTVNDLACWVSEVAFAHGVPREYALRKHTYPRLKAEGLGAQAAQHVIKKVRDAYTALHANIRAGNLGKPRSKRRIRAESKPVTFRPQAAQPYDDRCLSWQYDTRTVSIWTTEGRIKNVPFACSADALKALQQYRKGESDLIERDGVFYLVATCEVPEAEQYEPDGFIGVASASSTSPPRPPVTLRPAEGSTGTAGDSRRCGPSSRRSAPSGGSRPVPARKHGTPRTSTTSSRRRS